MVREIISNQAELQRTKIMDCTKDEAKQLITDLKETLLAQPDMQFLCANQIGMEESMFAVKCKDGDVVVFINPLCMPTKAAYNIAASYEVSLLDGKTYIMPREPEVQLYFMTEEGNATSKIFNDQDAFFMAKMTNALDGMDCSEVGLEVTPEFEQASQEERNQIVSEYVYSIQDLLEKLDADLSSDETYSRLWKQAKFDMAAANGEIEFEKLDEKPNRANRRLFNKLMKRGKKK